MEQESGKSPEIPRLAHGGGWENLSANHAGEAFVVDAKNGKILHRTMLGDKGDDLTRASVAIVGKQLFIRTNGTLFCVGR